MVIRETFGSAKKAWYYLPMGKVEKVAILGASINPERYSYKAFLRLQEHGHIPFPISPKLNELEGVKCYHSPTELKAENIDIDTLTVYINPNNSSPLIDKILDLGPKRIIFNPGAENPTLYEKLKRKDIEVIEACTLVLLSTDQFWL